MRAYLTRGSLPSARRLSRRASVRPRGPVQRRVSQRELATAPVTGPARVVRHRDNLDMLFANAVDDVERIFQEDKPTMVGSGYSVSLRRFRDALNGVSDLGLETGGGVRASLQIPVSRPKDFLTSCWVEPNFFHANG